MLVVFVVSGSSVGRLVSVVDDVLVTRAGGELVELLVKVMVVFSLVVAVVTVVVKISVVFGEAVKLLLLEIEVSFALMEDAVGSVSTKTQKQKKYILNKVFIKMFPKCTTFLKRINNKLQNKCINLSF